MTSQLSSAIEPASEPPLNRGHVAQVGLTVETLTHTDLSGLDALFQAHTGRQADLELLGSWIAGSPSAGARRGGELVGYLVTKRFAPDVTEIASLLIAPAERSEGIGSALVAHVERKCAAVGTGAIVVASSAGYATLEERRSPRRMYERLGYRVLLATAQTEVLGRGLDAGA